MSDNEEDVKVKELTLKSCVLYVEHWPYPETTLAPVYNPEAPIVTEIPFIQSIDDEIIRQSFVMESEAIMQWKVIGWTEADGNTLYVRHSAIDGDDKTRLYSDSIFPVLGYTHINIERESQKTIVDIEPVFKKDAVLLEQYTRGLVLVLHQDISVRPQKVLIQIAGRVQIPATTPRVSVDCVYMEGRVDGPALYNSVGIVHRIIDICNNDYPVVGLLGGTQTEYENSFHRILQDLDGSAPFSWHYRKDRKWIPRVGYLLSNDSLLFVTTSIDKKSSLLKESTFAILDGNNRIHMRYNVISNYKKSLVSSSSSGLPYAPKIAVTSEGVNALQIFPKTTGSEDNLQSYLLCSDPDAEPALLDWYQFHNDFQLTDTSPEIPFKQIMNIEDINDCIEYYYEPIGCHFLFSRFGLTGYNPSVKKELIEKWSIFVRIPNSDNQYIYMKSITLVFSPIPTGRTESMVFSALFQTKFEPNPQNVLNIGSVITDQRFRYFQTEYDRIRQEFERLNTYIPGQRFDLNFRIMCQTVSSEMKDQVTNAGFYTDQHMQILTMYNLKYYKKMSY